MEISSSLSFATGSRDVRCRPKLRRPNIVLMHFFVGTRDEITNTERPFSYVLMFQVCVWHHALPNCNLAMHCCDVEGLRENAGGRGFTTD